MTEEDNKGDTVEDEDKSGDEGEEAASPGRRIPRWINSSLLVLMDIFLSKPGKWTFHDRVATKIFEGFGEALFKEFMKGREPVSIIHHTRPGSSIKQPTPN